MTILDWTPWGRRIAAEDAARHRELLHVKGKNRPREKRSRPVLPLGSTVGRLVLVERDPRKANRVRVRCACGRFEWVWLQNVIGRQGDGARCSVCRETVS